VAATGAEANVYRFDEFRLDPARGTLHGRDDTVLEVRPKALALLCFLVEHPGKLHSRADLLETLWPDVVVTDDSLTQCISELRHAFGDQAPRTLKTVPRQGYVLTAEVRTESPTPAPDAPPSAASGRTALLILEPFGRIGDSPMAQLVTLLTTDLLTELTHFEGVRAFAAPYGETTGAYRIRGEVRGASRNLRVTVRLEDAATGAALWAERFDQPRGRPSELPEGLVETLSAALVRQVDRQDLRCARQKPNAELTVRELCLLGREHHQLGTKADTFAALNMFDRAIAAAPEYALAYAWMAYTVQREVTYGWGPRDGVQVARDRTLALARRAVEFDPESPLCLSRLAFALLLHQRWDEAVMTARAALRAGRPADYVSRTTCAEVLAHGGYPAEAVEAIRRALALDPHCPPITRALLGRALLLEGKSEEALPELRWCAAHLPDYVPCFHSLIVAAVETGRMEEARAALREAIRLQPDWVPCNHTLTWYFRRAGDVKRFLAAFRAAGLTEPEVARANDNLAEPWPPGGPADGPDTGRPVQRPVGSG
jgi:DNA-binding winged helix-turn-helix (wHTH) protein/tetratricopeptide (TPR) repeat protein